MMKTSTARHSITRLGTEISDEAYDKLIYIIDPNPSPFCFRPIHLAHFALTLCIVKFSFQ